MGGVALVLLIAGAAAFSTTEPAALPTTEAYHDGAGADCADRWTDQDLTELDGNWWVRYIDAVAAGMVLPDSCTRWAEQVVRAQSIAEQNADLTCSATEGRRGAAAERPKAASMSSSLLKSASLLFWLAHDEWRRLWPHA